LKDTAIRVFVYTTQLYGSSPVIWDHAVLPATQHSWTCPASDV